MPALVYMWMGESWVRVAPPSDNISFITRAHADYAFLSDSNYSKTYRTRSINDTEYIL